MRAVTPEASNATGEPRLQKSTSARTSEGTGCPERLAAVVVEVGSGGGAGEVGGAGERRELVAEVGAGDDRAGGDGRSRPISRATPISPIPRVPATVQELPIETATTRQIRQAVG